MDLFESENAHAKSEHSWTWVVTGCSNYLKASVGTKIVSPPFNIGNFKLEFWWYPGGTEEEEEEYVGVFLRLIEPDEAEIIFSLHIGYDTIKMFDMKKCWQPFESTDDLFWQRMPTKPRRMAFPPQQHGHSRIVKRETLKNQVLKLSNDELVIKCIIYGLDVPDTHNRLQILESYENFVDSKKFSDVKIIVGRKTIHAHKLVLANGSKVFAAMFEHDMLESKENIVKIKDIDYDVMQRVIRYMYTGKVERIFHKTKELLIAADKYALIEMKSLCEKYLCMDVSVENVFERIDLAQTYNLCELKETAEWYFETHAKEISQLPNLDRLLAGTRIDAELMARFIQALAAKTK